MLRGDREMHEESHPHSKKLEFYLLLIGYMLLQIISPARLK